MPTTGNTKAANYLLYLHPEPTEGRLNVIGSKRRSKSSQGGFVAKPFDPTSDRGDVCNKGKSIVQLMWPILVSIVCGIHRQLLLAHDMKPLC